MSTRIATLLVSQKNFLIQVSHELGSPLSRLNVALALARRKAGPAVIPELNRIQGDTLRNKFNGPAASFVWRVWRAAWSRRRKKSFSSLEVPGSLAY